MKKCDSKWVCETNFQTSWDVSVGDTAYCVNRHENVCTYDAIKVLRADDKPEIYRFWAAR